MKHHNWEEVLKNLWTCSNCKFSLRSASEPVPYDPSLIISRYVNVELYGTLMIYKNIHSNEWFPLLNTNVDCNVMIVHRLHKS